jgi:hypothetical protein
MNHDVGPEELEKCLPVGGDGDVSGDQLDPKGQPRGPPEVRVHLGVEVVESDDLMSLGNT